MNVYVYYDDPNNIIAVSTIATGMTTTSLLFNDGVLDVEKLEGYKVKTLEDGNHLIFDQELYDKKKKEKDEASAISDAQIKFEKIRSDIMLAQMSDEQALEIKALYPEWQSGQDYKTGDRLRYKDGFCKVLQDHKSQEDWLPTTASSLYVMIADPAIEYPDFKQPTGAHDVYNTGDKVTFEGKHYVCLRDNVAHSPKDLPDAWKEEGNTNE